MANSIYLSLLANSSYTVDPTYQRKFSITWAAVAGAAILVSLPTLIRSVRKGYTWAGVTGITEDLSGKAYDPISSDDSKNGKTPVTKRAKVPFERLHGFIGVLKSFSMWSIPQVGLDMGQGRRTLSALLYVFMTNYVM